MRVKLIFPPNARVNRPYLSLPALTAFLRESDIAVSQEDLNLAGLEVVMRPEHLSRCAEALEEMAEGYRGNRARILDEYSRYRSISLALLAAPVVIRAIEESLRFFRTADGFVDDEAYASSERILGEAANLVSAAHDPDPTALGAFTMACSPESSGDIFEAVLDEARDPSLPFLEVYVRDTLKREAPDLVGISLAAHSQVVPGLALARLIREHLPGTRSVVGGNIPTILAGKIGRMPRLFELFDYAVTGEGETPLLRLCQHLVGDCPIGDVPNLLYLDGNEVRQSPARSSEDVNELPTPDYDGLPLSRYLSPIPVLSLQLARGSSWRKCTWRRHSRTNGSRRWDGRDAGSSCSGSSREAPGCSR
jgi:anaerobic magnesium-protoporphyrin IX monomethyl ester cyclase